MAVNILPIEQPGVEIDVVYESASATPRSADLPPCVLAPCYRVVDAFDADGNANPLARAGVYQNSLGSIAYAFPQWPSGAVLDSDSVRVYLQSGSSANQLNRVADEVLLQTATGIAWSYVHTGGATYERQLTLNSGLVQTLGLQVGDVIRVTLPAVASPAPASITEVDLVVEAINSDTVVQVSSASVWGYDLSGTTYKLVQDAAQFVFNANAATAVRRVLSNTAVANDGIDFTAEIAGSLGDSVQVTFVDDATTAVEISSLSTGGFNVVIHYESTVTTWSVLATRVQVANDALPVGSRPFAGTSGVAQVGTGAGVMGALTTLVTLGDFDGTGTFLLDGGADADTLVLDADLLYTVYGIPIVATISGWVLVQYRALRVDVTESASVPVLLSYGSKTEMLADIGPEDTRNPLALMFSKAFDNAPTTRQYGLGISAVSSAFPDGTPAAWSLALGFLTSKRVYAIGALSQAPQVHQLLLSHALAMSTRSEKAERIVFFSRATPTNAADEVLVSGTANGVVTDVNTVGGVDDGDTFASGDNFTNAGVTAGDVLVIAGQVGPWILGNGLSGWYITASAAGSVLVDDRDNAGVNGAVWPQIASGLSWSIYAPGDPITQSQDRAQALAEYSYGFASKRAFHVVAPEVAITVGSTQQRLGGGYACAAIVGQISSLAPQLPHTNRALLGIDAVYGTHDSFSKGQLNLIAGGGSFILYQESDASPVTCRQQLSTDTTTVELSELSITKVLDYLAHFLRAVLRPFLGKFNITGAYLDTLLTQMEGHRSTFLQRGLVADFKLVGLRQDDTVPTLILADVVVDVYYPANTIRTTLRV